MTTAGLALAIAVLLSGPPGSRRAPLRRGGPVVARQALRRRLALVIAGAVASLGMVVLPMSACLAGAIVALTTVVRSRRGRRLRRCLAEAAALHTALDVLVGELRIGSDPLRAFEVAAAETEHPEVAAGLRGVAARARLGADVGAGLRDAAGSSALPGQWERLALYWGLGGRYGLAIANLMHAAQRDIASRQRFSARAEAGMAGARASATILGCLPVLGVLLGQLIGARPVGFLLTGPGGVLLVVGLGLVCTGLLWSDRITGRSSAASW